MKEKIRVLVKKGFFHIFGSNVINKIITFASGIILVRLLSKEDYGLFTYAQNILMFFILFNALGVNAGMLQYGSESLEKDKRDSFFNFGVRIGLMFNFLICLAILFWGNFLPIKIEAARPILISMVLLPLFMFLFESIQVYFRASLQNRNFSLLSTFNTFAIFVFSVTGAYLYNAVGVVLFRYGAYSISILVGLVLIKNYLTIFQSPKLNRDEKKKFMSFSIVSSFNNAVAQLLYIIDIFIIGLIIVDANVIAAYKTATLIPFALNFIPLSIVMFIYPYFARKNTDLKWIKQNYIRLTKYLFALNLIVSLILIIFAPLIIKILFGSQYLDAVGAFRILSFGYLIAGTFRIPVGNIIVMMKKVKFGLYLSIITGVLNIILDVVLIKLYGSIGAAIATVSVFIFTSIIGSVYLFFILKQKE
jgi:O-antigen/teichoic acid export membrane protein